MAEVSKKDFRAVLKEIEDLHGNMAVLARLDPILKDPNSELAGAASLIQTDGALAGSIIRISNSAYYAGGEPSSNVTEALRKVGFNEALRLVGIALSQQAFMRDLKAYGIKADDYWSYSYLSGLLLDSFAQRLGWDCQDAYLLGLLHGIGKVALNQLLHEEEVEIYWDPTFSSEEWEEIMIGFRYDEAGAILLKSWRFSEAVHERVRKQLQQDAMREDRMLLGLDYIRGLIAENKYEFNKEDWSLPTSHPFIDQSRSDPAVLEKEVRQARNRMAQIRSTLGNKSS